MASVLTVSEVNQYIKLLIEHDDLLADVMVKGEISNYKRHSSGHLYFTMKDEGGALLCVMFRTEASKLKFSPADGMKVIASGRLSVFVRDGRYQLYIHDLQPDGVGALYAAFEQLKEKLYKEGLFDSSRKLAIPPMPTKIALVTSPTGAAVRDMIRVLGKRFPLAKLLVCPVRVQGEGAAEEIAKALKLLSDKRTVELIILGRGGGSIEDLWPFNEEIVARAISACTIPIISAVGHEPDVTISDFVADLRAATPSNGAELAVPDSNKIYITLRNYDIRLVRTMDDRLKRERLRLKELAGRKSLSGPLYRINEQRLLLDYLEKKLSADVEKHLAEKRRRYTALKSTVEAINPLAVLGRGYSIATINGQAIRSAKEVMPGDHISIRLRKGQLYCLVEKSTENNTEQEGETL